MQHSRAVILQIAEPVPVVERLAPEGAWQEDCGSTTGTILARSRHEPQRGGSARNVRCSDFSVLCVRSPGLFGQFPVEHESAVIPQCEPVALQGEGVDLRSVPNAAVWVRHAKVFHSL